MTEHELDEAVRSVRQRGVHGVTQEFLDELETEGEAGVGSLDPTFDLEFFTPELDDMGIRDFPHRVTCGYHDKAEYGEGEASTPGKAAFLAFAEALEVFDLRAPRATAGDGAA